MDRLAEANGLKLGCCGPIYRGGADRAALGPYQVFNHRVYVDSYQQMVERGRKHHALDGRS